jgi:hypothetical protein
MTSWAVWGLLAAFSFSAPAAGGWEGLTSGAGSLATSSTSNTRVAPGGIAPGAPRSPYARKRGQLPTTPTFRQQQRKKLTKIRRDNEFSLFAYTHAITPR